jgi:hypothetical protein
MAQFDLPLSPLEQYLLDVREPADFDDWWTSTIEVYPFNGREGGAGPAGCVGSCPRPCDGPVPVA